MTVFNNINIAIAFVGIGGIIGQIMAKRKTKILKTDSYESNGYILIHGTVSKICPKLKIGQCCQFIREQTLGRLW